MRTVLRLLLCAILSCLLCSSPLLAGQTEGQAKKMFQQYGESSTRGFRNLVPDFGNNPQGFGIELKIEKQVGGVWQEVGLQHTFYTGDRVRFKVRPNGSTYIMITNNGNLIWPGGARGRNLIPDTEFQYSGAQEIVMGPFRVAPPAGREHNVLMMSPVPFSQQLSGLSQQTSTQPGQSTPVLPVATSPTGNVEMQDIAAIEAQLRTLKSSSRNLVYESENNVNYVVSNDSDPVKPIIYEFYMEHR